ncbi:hypothetical protein AJ88_03965 [Mesorhizobium amorphae CCBAU 01583]|nr:hypothetical protein AJ88_03965 [Mesorhizobium amorphae CCBAU 01583]
MADDDIDPRELLKQIIEDFPNASRQEHMAQFMAELLRKRGRALETVVSETFEILAKDLDIETNKRRN